MVDVPQGEVVLLGRSLGIAWARRWPGVVATGWNGQRPAQRGSLQQRLGSSAQKTNNFNICLGRIQFSSASLSGLNKLLPSRSEEGLMIYGSTGLTLVSAEFTLFCMEPCLSV